MISNLRDLKVWAAALGTGQMISPDLQAQRTQFQTITLDGVPPFYAAMDPGYGLALERYALPPNEFIGHSGKTSNFNTQMYYQPSTGSIQITLANTDTVAGYGPLFFATVAQAAFPGSFPGVTEQAPSPAASS
jgi:D-alanyl-D-alanine carboxypeptidase